jgi:hypothetical protein
MQRSVTEFAVMSALVSIPATVAATLLYIALVLEERNLSALRLGLFLSVSFAIRGLPLALIEGLILCFVRRRFTRASFVLVAMLTSALAGYLLGFFTTKHSPHVSSPIAAGLLASTWTVVATVTALVATRERSTADPGEPPPT